MTLKEKEKEKEKDLSISRPGCKALRQEEDLAGSNVSHFLQSDFIRAIRFTQLQSPFTKRAKMTAEKGKGSSACSFSMLAGTPPRQVCVLV